jgi:hypothetical protein
MGKASSAKKVAKAARAGGRSSGVRERNLLFPGIIAAIVILGVGLVAYARGEHQDAASTQAPRNFEDHWHSAYGIYICDSELPAANFYEYFETPMGIHSHQDGAIHIHPTSRGAAGENARLGVFIDESPVLDLDDDEITVGDETWVEGEDTCEVDGEEVPGQVVVAYWENVVDDSSPAIVQTGLDDLRFRGDGEGYMIAFVPEGEFDDIPKPTSASIIPSISQSLDNILPQDISEDDLDLFGDEDISDLSDFQGELEDLGVDIEELEAEDLEGGDGGDQPMGPEVPEDDGDE